jgi:membrane associated rhomboid family serine protease
MTQPTADLEPTTYLATALTPRACDAYGLVLQAVGIPYSILRDGTAGYGFWVQPADLARAREALALYVEENVPKPVEPPRRLAGTGIAAAAAYVSGELLIAIAASRSLFGAAWDSAGILDGESLRSGEWWRPVTALTLHDGLAHLASNLGFGALFIGLLARVYGTGVALGLTLAAATAGNLMEGAFMAQGHASLGASGAVFAALGILGTVHWPTRTARGRWTLRGATLIGALVLLALLGTGDARTDIEAHALGFMFGALMGLPLRRAAVPARRVQRLVGLAAALTLIAAWMAAILHAG